MNVVKNVLDRYSEGAKTRQESLCCPVDYDSRSLANLPQEIIEKDYGCGDPSRYVREGDVVLDLGSGGGKICYMAASLVGEQGRVIGVDMNDDMLALARKYQKQMAETIGSDRVEFHKAYIQDLALDVDAMENYLQEKPITNAQDLADLDAWKSQHKTQQPLIADHSVDLVISNCVLNLVDEKQKAQLVAEIFRVLKPGGRVAISDIVSDEIVPQHLQQDPSLWSGCISGAFQEYEFLQAFVDAGFNYVSYDKWDAQPWQVVEGIEFRSVTLLASKPLGTECIDRGHAVIYKGPFAKIYDDEGHVFIRGKRMAVCERTFKQLIEGDLADQFIGVQPHELLPAKNWCAPHGTERTVQETKGGLISTKTEASCC